MEQQLNTDQNGAMKPDVHTPFRDKADACKRLVRYHCYNQPVLSQKDLNKADEIFELTARHFIDKFSKMVDKYRYLLLKESMVILIKLFFYTFRLLSFFFSLMQRQVQTSELMMLDRMFLAEEQQSLIRLRQELEEGPPPDLVAQLAAQGTTSVQDQPQEEYDEWACIQRELGCLQSNTTEDSKPTNVVTSQANVVQQQHQQQKIINQPQQSNQNQLQQSIVTSSYQPPKRSASSDSRLETLKKFRVDKHSKRHNDSVSVQNNFVGGGNIQQSNNFNVPGGVCSASKTQGMRISHDVSRNVQQQQQQQQQQPSFTMHNTQSQASSSTNIHNNMQNVRHNLQTNVQQQHVIQHGSRNMHYTTQHPSTQGAYHSTNILHQQQYAHNVQFSHSQDIPQNLHTMYNPQTQQVNQHSAPSQHNINTSSVHSSVNNNNNGVNNNKNNNVQSHGSQSSESESGNNSIDEHVQSAIDSILNLQQNSNLDLDEAVSSILS